MKTICLSLAIILLNWTLAGCGDRIETSPLSRSQPVASPISTNKLAEVATPPAIEKLRRTLDRYEPQVTILSPQDDETLETNKVTVGLKVENLPIFKNSDLELGPHLTLILDNQPTQGIYDLSEPVLLEDLAPGTHTLRVFASRPWYESFKNDGAYAQTTFHVYTKNGNNTPDPSLPLLTYSRPRGTYGAEPILLDFYLTNAPLHVIAQENPEMADWRIKVTINGESFLLDDWQSIYLKGFQKGENWVQLEFIDEKGNKVENNYNNTVRIITYDPDYEDSLTKLVKGDIPIEVARSIVDPNYTPNQPPVESEPELVEEEPSETIEEPLPEIEIPETIEEPLPEIEIPETIENLPTTTEEPALVEPETIVTEEAKPAQPSVIEPEPQITTEAPPVLEQPTEPLKPEDTLPELIEEPAVPSSEEPLPESIPDEPITPPVTEPVTPLPETPIPTPTPTPTPKQSNWVDRLLKPFPLQKGVNPPVTPPKAVGQPEMFKTEPQPIPPSSETPFQATEPVPEQPAIEKIVPQSPELDEKPGKATIPKFI